VEPWESSHFGYYTELGFSGPVVEMEESRLYKEDLFGLKTMAERGGVEKCRYDGIDHFGFRDNPDMLEQCVLPAIKPYL